MKTIKKKISLEQFKSRMPSIISSYKDGVEYDFIDHIDKYTVNYNMLPKSVIINGNTISYSLLSEWYHFIENYNSLTDIPSEIQEQYDHIISYIGDFDLSIYFPCYYINHSYSDNWKREKLYVPDAIKWYKWFCDNENSEDCCIKEKYDLLGGNIIKTELKEFLDSYNKNIPINYADTYINLPIVLQNSISNMGEFTTYENNDKDVELPTSQSINIEDIYFSYKDNRYIDNPTHRKMSDYYDITYSMCCLIKNQLYVAKLNEYIEYNNKLIKVNYINNKPYVDVLGKRYYGISENGKFYFQFINFNNCNITNKSDKHFIQKDITILWNNYLYKVENQTVTLPIGKYFLADGYINHNNSYYLILNSNIVDINLNKDDILFGKQIDSIDDYQDKDNENYNYFIDNESNRLYVIKPYSVYSLLYVSGETESKLSSADRNVGDMVYDDLGNKMNGTYGSLQKIKENDWLNLLYSPNLVWDLSQDSDKKYWGSLITEMKFYYNDYYGKEIYSVTINCEDVCNKNITCLDKINELNDYISSYYFDENFINEHYTIDNTIMCDITYHIGCEISLLNNINNDRTLYEVSDYMGVKYIDTCKLIPKQSYFNVDSKDSFLVNYYEISWDNINTKIHNTEIKLNKSKFEYRINPIDYYKENNFIFKEEHKMRSSSIEKVNADIYIQRGMSKALDNHLKLLETKTFESLTKYGNGQFNIK